VISLHVTGLCDMTPLISLHVTGYLRQDTYGRIYVISVHVT
jgi:hypothetical protein